MGCGEVFIGSFLFVGVTTRMTTAIYNLDLYAKQKGWANQYKSDWGTALKSSLASGILAVIMAALLIASFVISMCCDDGVGHVIWVSIALGLSLAELITCATILDSLRFGHDDFNDIAILGRNAGRKSLPRGQRGLYQDDSEYRSWVDHYNESVASDAVRADLEKWVPEFFLPESYVWLESVGYFCIASKVMSCMFSEIAEYDSRTCRFSFEFSSCLGDWDVDSLLSRMRRACRRAVEQDRKNEQLEAKTETQDGVDNKHEWEVKLGREDKRATSYHAMYAVNALLTSLYTACVLLGILALVIVIVAPGSAARIGA